MEEKKTSLGTKKVAGALTGATASGASALKSTAATAASTKPAGSRFGSSTLGAAAASIKSPIKEVKDGESSGYSDFDEEEIE